MVVLEATGLTKHFPARRGVFGGSKKPGIRSYDMARRKKILVVDDERDLCELIGMNLQRNGYEVVTAHDGSAGLDAARKQKPDMVHIILTGRNAHPTIVELADTVTEMRQVKHAYEKGVLAQRGIEY